MVLSNVDQLKTLKYLQQCDILFHQQKDSNRLALVNSYFCVIFYTYMQNLAPLSISSLCSSSYNVFCTITVYLNVTLIRFSISCTTLKVIMQLFLRLVSSCTTCLFSTKGKAQPSFSIVIPRWQIFILFNFRIKYV